MRSMKPPADTPFRLFSRLYILNLLKPGCVQRGHISAIVPVKLLFPTSPLCLICSVEKRSKWVSCEMSVWIFPTAFRAATYTVLLIELFTTNLYCINRFTAECALSRLPQLILAWFMIVPMVPIILIFYLITKILPVRLTRSQNIMCTWVVWHSGYIPDCFVKHIHISR